MWADYPDGDRPDPRMVYPLADRRLLVSGGKDVPYVMEVDQSGTVVWEYEHGTDGLLRKPFSAEPATFGGRRLCLDQRPHRLSRLRGRSRHQGDRVAVRDD